MKSLDFIMRKIMDTKMVEFGTSSEDGLGVVDLSGYGMNSPKIHIASNGTTAELESEREWIQSSLTKIPSDILTRGPEGLTEKKGLYTVFVKVNKDSEEAEYLTEALSSEIEEHFQYNQHLTLGEYLLTIKKTYQQPNVALNSDDGRYWNRVFIECEIYHKNN